MSQFITRIPVDVEAVTKLLPNMSHIEGFDWNGNEIELRWSNHLITSPFTFHLEFSVEQLRARRLPEGAKHRETARAVPTVKRTGVVVKSAKRKGAAD